MTDRNHADLRQGIVDTCQEMNRNGLNQGTSGNLSHRIPNGMLITPTSLPYDRMRSGDIVAMDFAANYEGNHRPSSEWRFHRDILRARDDVNVVLHTHSTFSTILAVHERGIPCFHYMVAVAGGNDIRCSPYACFGTQALSNHAVNALEGRNACLLGHHGLIVTAQTFEKALWLAVEVETLAKMYVHALAIGEPPQLSEVEMAQVHEQMKRMGYGQAPDLDDVGDLPRAVPKSKRRAHVDLMTAGRFTQHRPASANEGLGRKLLAARTGSTSEAGREIRMTVVNIRDTLIAWYLRVRTDQRDRAVPLG